MENTLESDFILSLQRHVIYKQFDYTTIIMGHPVVEYTCMQEPFT